MRKNSARKWLHATLDLLPVVIIPIFALYATNKNATFAQEINVSQNKVVDFNQLAYTNISYNNYGLSLESVENTNNVSVDSELITDLVYYFSSNLEPNNIYISYVSNPSNISLTTNTIVINQNNYTRFNSNTENGQFFMYFSSGFNDSFTFTFRLFNLTQMFGSGNEPTIEQFTAWYSNDYYAYTLSEKQLLKDYDQITYNDTDIGSQFIYGLYNSVDKYFNIGNVFNLGSIYDWLNLNIFNGNSPIAIFIVWNIVAYEFLMDLLFLLYGLFMFFIDTCTNLMDRFYCNLSGRR